MDVLPAVIATVVKVRLSGRGRPLAPFGGCQHLYSICFSVLRLFLRVRPAVWGGGPARPAQGAGSGLTPPKNRQGCPQDDPERRGVLIPPRVHPPAFRLHAAATSNLTEKAERDGKSHQDRNSIPPGGRARSPRPAPTYLAGRRVGEMGNNWLTLPEAAEVLRIAPRTLSRLVRFGRVPHIGRGRLLRFRRDNLENLRHLPTRTELEAPRAG